MITSIKQAAIDIIKNNDQGSYTIPTKGLYPFQWNWDSGFSALGFAQFDLARAWLEVQTLLKGQWDNGMIPHILFWQDDEGYFPNKDMWDSQTSPASSGYSQPPVLSSMVLRLAKLSNEQELKIVTNMLDQLFKYHQWYHVNRDPNSTGLVASFHPWETGRDNCPEWDEGMGAVDVKNLREYHRRDLDHVDASNRPTKWYYDRFLALLEFGRNNQWNDQKIYQDSPFLYCDVGIQFILMRADNDLLELIKLLDSKNMLSKNYDQEIKLLEQWLSKSNEAVDKLFSQKSNCYTSLNLNTNELTNCFSNASALAWYAKLNNQDNLSKSANTLNNIASSVKYLVPSWDPQDEKFDAKRYWQGPVWAIMNYMIAEGLQENNELSLAKKIKKDTQELIETTGFCEYFDPLTAAGLGGNSFSWTAAIYLILLAEQE